MNINELSESKYLKKEDVMTPTVVKIASVSIENLAQQGEPPENKWILHLVGSKPLVLNKTNANIIAHVLQSPETDDWIGKSITLYNDPTVGFAGKITGGIRVAVQPVSPQGKPVGQAPSGAEFIEDDDIPFS